MEREIVSNFMNWSKDLGLAVTILQDPNADFHIVVSEPNLPAVDIVHPKPDSKIILFASRITIPEEQQKRLSELLPEQREDILWDVRFKLLSMNLEFRLIRPEGPTAWELINKVFIENITEQIFFDTYLKLKNAIIAIIWSYRRALERKPFISP